MYLLKYVYTQMLVREHVQVKSKSKGFFGFGRLYKESLPIIGKIGVFL